MLVPLVAALAVPGPCAAGPGRGPRLPAPIVAVTGCGTYEADRNGAIRRLPRHWLARHGSGTGRVYGARLHVGRPRDGHIELRAGSRLVWRSVRAYRNDGGEIAFGPDGLVAFASYRRGIFLARPGRPERLVLAGRGLYPIGFTRRGDLLATAGGGRIELLSADGTPLRRLRFGTPGGFAFDERRGVLVFVTPERVLAQLVGRRLLLRRRLEGGGSVALLPHGLLSFAAQHELVVRRADGSVVARARWSKGELDSGVVGSPDGRAFAFRLRLDPARRGSRVRLYVLPAGASRPRLVLAHRLAAAGCAVGASLSWHDRLLLYVSSDGRAAVVDRATSTSRDLAPLLRALPRTSRTEIAAIVWRSEYS